MPRLGKTCETCLWADETDSHDTVTCDCMDSDHFEDEVKTTFWCKWYKET